MVKQNRYNRQSRLTAALASESLASGVRQRIGVGRVNAAGDHRRGTIVRTVAAARARMIVHPVGHEAIAVDERKQMLGRAVVPAAATAER